MSDVSCTWSLDEYIPSYFGSGKDLQESILVRLAEYGWTEHDLFGVRLALEEALANAVKHGNRHDANKRVHVHCQADGERLYVQITDEGEGFNPEVVPDPTEDEHLDAPSGRGIMLMRAFMCQVKFNACGNCVEMEKRRPAAS